MRRRSLAFGSAALLLVAIGFAIGRAATRPERTEIRGVTTTVTVPTGEKRATAPGSTPRIDGSGHARTPEGAASAAAAYVSALSGPTILDAPAVRRTLTAIVSTQAQDALISAYRSAAARARGQLGVESASDPAVVLRAATVGYRVDGFQPEAAIVSVWRVGIAGGPSVPPRQSWRTETLSLVWEDGTWKIDAVRSSPGPTPPLAGVTTESGELATTIGTFEEPARELP